MKLHIGKLSFKSVWLEVVAISLVLFIAAFFRFWKLGTVLHGFHNDEVMNGYVGRYILENGFDLYGNRWPVLYFNNFGDYPNVVPMYLSGIGTAILGVNEFGVRLPVALAGVGIVAAVYLITRWLYASRWLAILAALMVALLPWQIVLSRATAEGVTATLVFLLGILFVFKGLAESRWLEFLSGWLALVATYLLYPGFRVFVPLAFLPAVLFARKQLRWLTIGLSITLFVLTFGISQTVWGKGRYEQTSLFTHNNVIGGRAQNYSIGLGSGRVFEARLFHNKYVLAGREFARQYASYFSPDFLAGTGGKPYRYLVPEHGVLYWSLILVPVSVVAWHFWKPWRKKELLALFRDKRAAFYMWLLWIIAVAPVPAALTLDDVPNVHRSAVLGVLLVLVSVAAWSLLAGIRWKKHAILFGLAGIILLAEFGYFWHYYTNLSSLVTTPYRKDEQRALSQYLLENSSQYERVYAPGGELLPIHLLFQGKDFSPEWSQKFREGLQTNQIGNVVLLDNRCPSLFPETATQSGVLIVDRDECPKNSRFEEVGRVFHLDETTAYRLLIPQAGADQDVLKK